MKETPPYRARTQPQLFALGIGTLIAAVITAVCTWNIFVIEMAFNTSIYDPNPPSPSSSESSLLPLYFCLLVVVIMAISYWTAWLSYKSQVRSHWRIWVLPIIGIFIGFVSGLLIANI